MTSVESGYYSHLREIRRFPLLTHPEEIELARRVRDGDEDAREQMIHANLRLVVTVARKLQGRGLPLMDLVAEGHVGLLKAVERFDPDEGTRFGTYAWYWIQQAARRAIENGARTVREFPGYLIGVTREIRTVEEELRQKLGREPTLDEIEHAVAPDSTRHDQIERAWWAEREGQHTESLDAPVDPEDGDPDSEPASGPARLADELEDPHSRDPVEEVLGSTEIDRLDELLGELDDRSRNILEHRFGLAGHEPFTLKEIGKSLGFSRERARQLEKEALEMLLRILRRSGRRAQ